MIATLAGTSLLLGLGFWQLSRAQDKQVRHALFVHRAALAPIPLDRATGKLDPDSVMWRRVSARGRYRDLQFVLDNRIHNGVVGVEVLTVFELDGGAQFLVDRGWMPVSADRRTIPHIPSISGQVDMRGHIGYPPATGLRFNPRADLDEAITERIIRVQWVNTDGLNDRYGLAVPPFIVFLADSAPGGFGRDWTRPGNESGRHIAYAVQWFAMAGVLVVIYIVLSLREKAPP